jgi:hypothetical protein
LDGTQTSEPTEAGPGFPGRASAYRRALDETAATEGPLDLTIPLNIAEVRAALSTTGPHARARSAAAAEADASVSPARPQEGRAGSRHAGPKRLGRIFAFVAVTAGLSVGTAGALVMSDNTSNQSVSLPASGAIPVAPTTNTSQSGGRSMGSGSTSAHATPSLSHSMDAIGPIYASRTTSQYTTPSSTAVSSATATASASGSASGYPSSSISPPDVPVSSANWQPLYQGDSGGGQQSQETSDVQTLLNNLGLLEPWRHRTYVLSSYSNYAAGPDPTGHYGSATSDAIAEFQQEYSVPYTGTLGVCDLTTYESLTQVIASATADQSPQ